MKYHIKDRNICEIFILQILSSQKFNNHESEWKFKVTNEPDVAGNNKETEYLWINGEFFLLWKYLEHDGGMSSSTCLIDLYIVFFIWRHENRIVVGNSTIIRQSVVSIHCDGQSHVVPIVDIKSLAKQTKSTLQRCTLLLPTVTQFAKLHFSHPPHQVECFNLMGVPVFRCFCGVLR